MTESRVPYKPSCWSPSAKTGHMAKSWDLNPDLYEPQLRKQSHHSSASECPESPRLDAEAEAKRLASKHAFSAKDFCCCCKPCPARAIRPRRFGQVKILLVCSNDNFLGVCSYGIGLMTHLVSWDHILEAARHEQICTSL